MNQNFCIGFSALEWTHLSALVWDILLCEQGRRRPQLAVRLTHCVCLRGLSSSKFG